MSHGWLGIQLFKHLVYRLLVVHGRQSRADPRNPLEPLLSRGQAEVIYEARQNLDSFGAKDTRWMILPCIYPRRAFRFGRIKDETVYGRGEVPSELDPDFALGEVEIATIDNDVQAL